MDDFIIKASNIMLAIIAGFGTAKAFIWKVRNRIAPESSAIVFAWVLILASVGIRATYFATARFFAEEGERWSTSLDNYRSTVIVGTSLMFVWGMLSFIRHIEDTPIVEQVTMFAMVVLTGIIVSGFSSL